MWPVPDPGYCSLMHVGTVEHNGRAQHAGLWRLCLTDGNDAWGNANLLRRTAMLARCAAVVAAKPRCISSPEHITHAWCRRWIERINSKLREKAKKEETKRLKSFVGSAFDQVLHCYEPLPLGGLRVATHLTFQPYCACVSRHRHWHLGRCICCSSMLFLESLHTTATTLIAAHIRRDRTRAWSGGERRSAGKSASCCPSSSCFNSLLHGLGLCRVKLTILCLLMSLCFPQHLQGGTEKGEGECAAGGTGGSRGKSCCGGSSKGRGRPEGGFPHTQHPGPPFQSN